MTKSSQLSGKIAKQPGNKPKNTSSNELAANGKWDELEAFKNMLQDDLLHLDMN